MKACRKRGFITTIAIIILFFHSTMDMEKKVKDDPTNKMCNNVLFISYNSVLEHYFYSSMLASYAI